MQDAPDADDAVSMHEAKYYAIVADSQSPLIVSASKRKEVSMAELCQAIEAVKYTALVFR